MHDALTIDEPVSVRGTSGQGSGPLGPRVPYVQRCLHELIADQAARRPGAVALELGAERLTYGELDERANQLANHLRDRGVAPEVLVGLSMDRSFELLVGILGILKAGGAYLPLDPDYPAERLRFMVADAGIGLLVTRASLAPGLGEGLGPALAGGVEVVVLDADPAVAAAPRTAPDSGVTLDHLIYVMYTSGSTGRPKGVMVAHRGVTSLSEAGTPSLVRWGTRVLQFHSPSFDPSVWEITLSLARGGTLVLGSRDDLMPGPSLARLLADHQVETLVLPASALAALPFRDLPHLRNLFLEGEVPSTELVRRWGRDRLVFNTYGPTEASMWCVGCPLDGVEHPPPIGRPVANAEAHILDEDGRQVPPGLVGELHIGGVGLARGYLGRPDLTAERFVPHPFDDTPGARLYRTGDLARERPDGLIDFLGRLDDQVKIRGFRVELGEVEEVLLQHPGVLEAAAAAHDSGAGHKRLVAYVVGRHGAAPGVGELRSFVRERLPDHLVPSAFVALGELPRSPTGKLDRRALPAPDEARPELDQALVAPSGPTQEALAQIWCDVLGLDEVGARDDFFDLGGDSLLTILMLAEVDQRLGTALGAEDVQDVEPTIEALAALVDGAISGGAGAGGPGSPAPGDAPEPARGST